MLLRMMIVLVGFLLSACGIRLHETIPVTMTHADVNAPVSTGDTQQESITYSGHLVWTGIGGDMQPRQHTYTHTFENAAYLRFELTANPPELIDMTTDILPPCRVIGLVIDPRLPADEQSTVINGTQIIIGLNEQDRLLVEPGEYRFEVRLLYMTQIGGVHNLTERDITCPDADYSLTIFPAAV